MLMAAVDSSNLQGESGAITADSGFKYPTVQSRKHGGFGKPLMFHFKRNYMYVPYEVGSALNSSSTTIIVSRQHLLGYLVAGTRYS